MKRFSQIKRFSKSPVYVKNTIEENAVSNDILKLPNGLLELEKPFKLFDMKKFQQNVNREMKRTYPDRRKLESQCISAIAFVRNEPELLDSPIWIMLINIVALEMLRVKLPAGTKALPGSFSKHTYLDATGSNFTLLTSISPYFKGLEGCPSLMLWKIPNSKGQISLFWFLLHF